MIQHTSNFNSFKKLTKNLTFNHQVNAVVNCIREHLHKFDDRDSIEKFLIHCENKDIDEINCFKMLNPSFLNYLSIMFTTDDHALLTRIILANIRNIFDIKEIEQISMLNSYFSSNKTKFNFEIKTVEDLSVFLDYTIDNNFNLVINNRLNLPSNFIVEGNNFQLAKISFSKPWILDFIKRVCLN